MKNRFGWIFPSKPPGQASRALLLLRSFGLMFAAICIASAAMGETHYRVTRLPTSSDANSVALGLNDKGEIAGYTFQGDDYHAFLYSHADNSVTDVGSLGGKINAACAINAAGLVTGYSEDENGKLLAFIFSRQKPIASLGTLEGGSSSEAFGINNRGEVVGDSQSGNQNHRPALFAGKSVQDLGLGGSSGPDAFETAYAINDSGQIAGRHASNDAFHAFQTSDGKTADLGTLGGANSEALAINKNGHTVGDSDTADGTTHAFLFDGSLKDLGTLPGYEKASFARGINDSDDVVGDSESVDQKRAFLYSKGQLLQLDQVAENLDEIGFVSLDVAYGINNEGWIVGYGTTSDNLTAAFVAVPVPSTGPIQGRVNAPAPQTREQDQGERVSESDEDNYDLFYSRLSSDGSWIDAGDYGYAFRPDAPNDWQPYQDGHWVWTDRGWYWNSNEAFGWATYHYGRWVRIQGTGWCWVPGHEWAPAWVSWRQSDAYVGWAPLPPEADISGHASISSWADSYYDIGPSAYVFIRYAHWFAPSYRRYCEPRDRNVRIINRTKNVTNIVYNNTVINNYGPRVQNVSAKTKRNIQEARLAVNRASGRNARYGQTLNGNQLNVVAPPPVLKPAAKQTPRVKTRLVNPVAETGWQDIKPAEAARLKTSIARQNPPPADLPKRRIPKKEQVESPTGPRVGSQKQLPPNLVAPKARPGEKMPEVRATPGISPNPPMAGKKSVPPNLIGERPAGRLKTSPGPETEPVATPEAVLREPGPRPATTPVPEKKSEAASIPTPQPQAPNLGAPKSPSVSNPEPSPRAKARQEQPLVQKPAPVAPNPQPQVKAPSREPQRQSKAPASRPHQQAKPPAPRPQQQAKAPVPKPQRQAQASAPRPHQQAKPAAPRPQQQRKAPAPKPQQQKPAAQKKPPTKQGGKGAKENPNPNPKKKQ
jgi:probable HAF family extracellular repeat protein